MGPQAEVGVWLAVHVFDLPNETIRPCLEPLKHSANCPSFGTYQKVWCADGRADRVGPPLQARWDSPLLFPPPSLSLSPFWID